MQISLKINDNKFNDSHRNTNELTCFPREDYEN